MSVSTKTLRAHDLPEAVDGLEMHADWLQLDCLQHFVSIPAAALLYATTQ